MFYITALEYSYFRRQLATAYLVQQLRELPDKHEDIKHYCSLIHALNSKQTTINQVYVTVKGLSTEEITLLSEACTQLGYSHGWNQ